MRKHGWQLPYHLLQVVAVSVFLALGVAFYVFFVPFVGWKKFQYIIMGIYTSLITIVFSLYIWCAAADPGDPGIFKSKKYLNIMDNGKNKTDNESKHDRNSLSSRHETNASIAGDKSLDNEGVVSPAGEIEGKTKSSYHPSCCMILLGWCSSALVCCSKQHEESHEQQMSEDGMFYCSLCKVEVFKYSKHCRVCDKCVDQFDHHCRWLNNCIGKRNYRQFFTLMVSALLLLILQWSTGILVMICCFLERKRFSTEISSKLGSSFSFAPFIIVVACCTILAMIATLPLVQLFFFHVLLIKKGISTYDYIIAMREQKQQLVGGEQSPQMSPAPSSIAGLSTGSSFNTFHRAAWCTPPRLFLEDRFDVVAPDTNMPLNSPGKRNMWEQPIRKKKSGTVKINPWTLARLNGNEVSRIAAEAKKSKILQSLGRREVTSGLETDSSFDSSGRMAPRPENRRRTKTPNSLAPLQLEARSAFRTSRAMSAAAGNVISSPESSLQSPDIRHPSHVSSSAEEEARGLVALSEAGSSKQKEIPLSRCASDGYEASGGEDSDRVPTRTMLRSTDFTKFFYSSG